MENEHGSTTTISAFLSKLMELEEYGRVGGKKKMVETIAEGDEEEEEEDDEEATKEVEAVMQGHPPTSPTSASPTATPSSLPSSPQGQRKPSSQSALAMGDDEEEEGEDGDTGEDDLFGPCNTREEEEAKARAFAALTDRCAGCQQTLEEQCVRSGPWRWHDSCLMCVTCGVPLVLGREERHAQRQIQVQQAFGRSPSTSSTASSTSSLARNPRLDHMSLSSSPIPGGGDTPLTSSPTTTTATTTTNDPSSPPLFLPGRSGLGRRMTKAERRRTLTLPLTRPGCSIDTESGRVYCPAHAPSLPPPPSSPSSYMGEGSPPPPSSSALTDHAKFTTARFTRVSQLKQYVFLLRVAQQHLILKLMSSQKGLSSDPSSPFPSSSSAVTTTAALGGGHIAPTSSPVRATDVSAEGASVRMGPSSSTWGSGPGTTNSHTSSSPNHPSNPRSHPSSSSYATTPQAGGMRGPGPSDHPSSSQRPNHPNTSSSTSTTTSRRRGRDEVEGLDRRLSNSAQLAKRRTIVHHQPITTAAASGLPEDGTSSAGPSPSNSRSPLGTAPPPSSFSSSSTTTTTTTMIAPTVTPSGHPPPASYPSSSMTNAPYHPTSSPNLKDPSARHPQSRRKFLSELSPLELALVRHLAVLFMHPYVSKLDSYYDAMDPLMVLVDPSRSSLWRRLKTAMNKGSGGGGSGAGGGGSGGGGGGNGGGSGGSGGGGSGGHVNDVGDHPPNPSQTISSKVSSTFGVPLDVLVERTGVTAPFGLGPIPLKVPSFLAAAIGTLREKDVTIEGIYRKNGNIRRLRELTETIDRSRGSLSSITALLAKENAVQVAALVKKFLRDLPDPLLSYKIHRLLITICKMEEDVPSMSDFSPGANGNILDGRVHLLHLAYCLLPEENRDVLEVLLAHFRWISQFAELEDRGNKMDLSNMATVVTPNILYSKSKDPSRDESFYANEVVLTLLESQDELSMVWCDGLACLNIQGFPFFLLILSFTHSPLGISSLASLFLFFSFHRSQ